MALVKLTVATALVRLVQKLLRSLSARGSDASHADAILFDAAWPALIEQLRPWATVGLELTTGDGETERVRHTWRLASLQTSAEREWCFAVSFREQADHYCEVRVMGQSDHSLEPWQQTRVCQLLTEFCQFWARHSVQIPASHHWSDAADGRPVPLPATLSVHPATKAA